MRPSRGRPIHRREFLRAALGGASWFLGATLLPACGGGGGGGSRGGGGGLQSNISNLGPLQPADANGLMLPPGFTSRVVAQSGISPDGGGTLWHPAPDGGATFDAGDGGWIYVSNSEIGSGGGGVGALRFDAAGNIVSAYSILSGTNRNCAGGRTPWGTWLSCEEVAAGLVYECDPFGVASPVVLPSLGLFQHEAIAADPVSGYFYLTEDRTDGGFYRFRPSNPAPDLSAGTLEIAEVAGGGPEGTVVWHAVPDPSATAQATRYQVAQATPFNGGEGIAHFNGSVYFVTKGDNRVWRYDAATGALSILYDDGTHSSPILAGVDNVETSLGGELLVAEDGGDMQIVAITPQGATVPVCQIVGHNSSEIAGPAFSPDFTRLYFSSQRGTTGNSADGMTFEIAGPFVT